MNLRDKLEYGEYDVLHDILADTDEPHPAEAMNEEKLGQVAVLARELAEVQDHIDEMEMGLKALVDHRRNLEEVKIPEALAEIGLSQIRLTSGETVSISPFYNASINKANPWPALEWLEGQGFGGLIKRKMSVALGRDSEEDARQVRQMFEASGHQLSEEVGVHPQTLKAFVREQLEAGNDLPRELFNVYVGQKAKIGRK